MKARSKKRKPIKRKPVRAIVRTRTKIVHVRTEAPKPWLVSAEEANILKNSVCKGATDAELKFCLLVAARYRLDPFRQQIFFVPRWDAKATNSQGKEGAVVYVPQVSIGGLLHVAARDHKDFGSYSEPEFGPDIIVKWGSGNPQPSFKAPEWARVSTIKKGDNYPTTSTVYWEEIYKDVDKSPMVRRMPRLMLAKCARAQVTRIAYPETGGLYIPEESQGREYKAITPGGRLISEAVEPGGGSREAAQAAGQRVIEQKKKEIAAHNAEKSKTIDVPSHPPATQAGSPTPQATPAAPTPRTEPAKSSPPPKQAARPTTGVPPANIQPSDMGLLESFVVKPNSNGGQRGEILRTGETKPIYIFGNHEMQIAGAKPERVFDLLKKAKGQPCRFVLTPKVIPAKNAADDGKQVWEVKQVLQIGPYEWEDGMPVIRREPATNPQQASFAEREPGADEDGLKW
jgi:hypothetical protein